MAGQILYYIKPACCPECGGRIQGTMEDYLDSRDEGDGTAAVWSCDMGGDVRWYCENDHPVEVEIEECKRAWTLKPDHW